MDATERLQAIEDIKQVKARYLRGVDTADGGLVRGILADDCVLDYRGCCTDLKTGRDFFPALNMVMEGAGSWPDAGLSAIGVTSVHQGYNPDICVTSDTTAQAIWSMTDRLFMPPDAEFSLMTGYGFYHETYEKVGSAWKLKTLKITRLKIDVV